MEENRKEQLCGYLDTLDTSLLFIGLLLLATALSWRAAAVQRDGLCWMIQGKLTEVPDVFPLRLTTSGIAVGALVYFFGLALDNRRTAQAQGEPARRSADMNVWASLLVLAAALIRLYDLNFVQWCARQSRAVEEEVLPD